MIRVEIVNFQSIAHQVIDIDGFSAVVGRSNIGKSAMVRAIKAALTGAPADDYVRHVEGCPRVKGAKSCKCSCSVRITGPDLDLTWEKGDAVNRYLYNGREYTVVGRGTPEFLGAPFEPVELGGERVLLQVFDQFAPLFLLDRSGTTVADTLSDVAKLDRINGAVRLAERDRKDATSTRRVRQKDLAELGVALAGYEPLDAIALAVGELEASYEATRGLETRAARLQRYDETLRRSQLAIEVLVPVAIMPIPSVASVVDEGARLTALGRLLALREVREAKVAAYDRVNGLVTPDRGAVEELARRYDRLLTWTEQVAALRSHFATFDVVEKAVLPDAGRVEALGRQATDLDAFHVKLVRCTSLGKEIQGKLAELESDLAEVDEEFAGLGVCPTCAQPIRLPQLHEREAAACLD